MLCTLGHLDFKEPYDFQGIDMTPAQVAHKIRVSFMWSWKPSKDINITNHKSYIMRNHGASLMGFVKKPQICVG